MPLGVLTGWPASGQEFTQRSVDELLRRRRRKGQIAEGEPEAVSELVQALLAEWLEAQGEK